MKRTMILAALALSAASAFAIPDFGPRYLPAEVQAIKEEFGAQSLGELKVSDLVPLAERLDVARQKDRFVMMAAGLSAFWPGAGQIASGEWGPGLAYTGLHLGITAGTLYWAHSLLPSDLRLENLDYFDESHSAIDDAWNRHTMNDYWPAVGALAAGGVVDLVLRAWSAQDARATAETRINEGKIAFEPRFDQGHFGMGMRF